MSRVFSDDITGQIFEALSGKGSWIIQASKLNLTEGAKRNQNFAKQFENKESYIPFFEDGDYYFPDSYELIQEERFYTIEDLEYIAKASLHIEEKKKDLKPGYDIMNLIDTKGNYSVYRNLLKTCIKGKKVITPYLGLLRRDLVFTMDGAENYVDERK